MIADHLTLRHNRAVGGTGNTAGNVVGVGFGGAFANDGGPTVIPCGGSQATLRDSIVADNEARGGAGGPDGSGGDAEGGGIADIFGGTLTVADTLFQDAVRDRKGGEAEAIQEAAGGWHDPGPKHRQNGTRTQEVARILLSDKVY